MMITCRDARMVQVIKSLNILTVRRNHCQIKAVVSTWVDVLMSTVVGVAGGRREAWERVMRTVRIRKRRMYVMNVMNGRA